MNLHSIRKNELGQMTVELVLLMTVMMGIVLTVRNKFIQDEFLHKMISGPWSRVAAAIETGTFSPIQQARLQHPGKLERHLSVRGEQE